MAKREVISLPSAQVEVEERDGHLFVVESGQLRNLVELKRYHDAVDAVIGRTGIRHAIIDARGEVGDPPVEVRDEMWRWLLDPDRGFETVAFVLPTEMAVARVNMTSLSKRAQVRAFDSVFAAQRWLARGPRFSTQASVRTPSSHPPAPSSRDSSRQLAHAPTEHAFKPPEPPGSAGAYYTTSTKTERPGAPLPRDDEPQASARDVRQSDFRTKGVGASYASDGGRGGKTGGGGSQVA